MSLGTECIEFERSVDSYIFIDERQLCCDTGYSVFMMSFFPFQRLISEVTWSIVTKFIYMFDGDQNFKKKLGQKFGSPSVTVGQLVYFVVSCFMSSRSGFLYTFCVYSPCSVNWNGCARRLVARVTIM